MGLLRPRMSRLVTVLLAACSPGQSTTPPRDAGLDVVELPLDAASDGACALPNGGSGTCGSESDCPPEDACWAWVCESVHGESPKCNAIAKDGGK